MMGRVPISSIMLTLVGVAIAAGPAAYAQIPSSSSDTGNRDKKQGLIDGVRELKRLATCTYARVPGYFDSLLRTPPGSSEESAILHRSSNVAVNCMNSLAPVIYFDGLQMRGAFAEARYLAANPTPPAFDTMDHAMIAIPAAWTERKMADAEKAAILKYDFADCVVAADPASADALVRTQPASSEEAAVVTRIVPLLGPCLQAKATYKLDAPILRALLAQSLDSSSRKWASVAPPARGARQ